MWIKSHQIGSSLFILTFPLDWFPVGFFLNVWWCVYICLTMNHSSFPNTHLPEFWLTLFRETSQTLVPWTICFWSKNKDCKHIYMIAGVADLTPPWKMGLADALGQPPAAILNWFWWGFVWMIRRPMWNPIPQFIMVGNQGEGRLGFGFVFESKMTAEGRTLWPQFTPQPCCSQCIYVLFFLLCRLAL